MAFPPPPTSDSSSTTLVSPSTSTTNPKTKTLFTFPPSHSFPPLYTLQPNPTTRLAQYTKWSHIILLYCSHHLIYRLTLPVCLSLSLFRNTALRRRLEESSLRAIITWMSSEEGGRRAEWVEDAGGGAKGKGMGNTFWVFWKRPEEWADVIWGWVEGTGQRGAVVTIWEMLEGEGTLGEGFHGMDPEVFNRALGVLVKRGKTQVFGEDEGRGVKFF